MLQVLGAYSRFEGEGGTLTSSGEGRVVALLKSKDGQEQGRLASEMISVSPQLVLNASHHNLGQLVLIFATLGHRGSLVVDAQLPFCSGSSLPGCAKEKLRIILSAEPFQLPRRRGPCHSSDEISGRCMGLHALC